MTTHTCRYYSKSFPTNNDIVIVKVGSLTEFGYHVNLLEYENADGFINLSEFMRGKGKMKKKYPIKEGDVVPLTVLRVDIIKRHIDLSKKKMDDKVNEEAMNKYRYTSHLHRVGREVYQMYKEFCESTLIDVSHDIESVMNSTIWRLYNIYEEEEKEIENMYTDILKNPNILFNSDNYSESFINSAVENISNRIIKTNVIKEVIVQLLVTDKEGVTIIKKILSNDNNNISIFVESPPHYIIRLEAKDASECDKILTEYLEAVKKRAIEFNAEFSINNSIKTVKETSIDLKFLPSL